MVGTNALNPAASLIGRVPGRAALVISLLVLGAPGAARAQFQEPIGVSSNPEAASLDDWEIGVDNFNNVVLAVVEDGNLTMHSILADDRRSHVIPSSTGKIANPTLAFTALRTYVAFTDVEADSIEEGGEVFLTSKVGSTVSPTRNFSANDFDDRHAAVTLGSGGVPIVAWTRVDQDGVSEVVVRSDSGDERVLGEGDHVRVKADAHGVIHLIFVNDSDDLVYLALDSLDDQVELPEPVVITNFAGVAEPFHSLRTCDLDTVFVSYNDADTLYLTRLVDGAFDEPREIVHGEFHTPSFVCNPSGVMVIGWEREGDVFFRYGGVRFLLPEERALATPEIEREPKFAIDSYLNVYLTYRRDNELFFATNASIPQAELTANPTEGEVPLKVQFTDLSRGNVVRWRWDFGDGVTSGSQNPEHEYAVPGLYTVTLVIEGPGGTSSAVGEKEIRVLDPSNSMTLSDRRAFAGQREIYVPVTIENRDPIQGCQIAASFDPAYLDLVRVDLTDATNFKEVDPELIISNTTDLPNGRVATTTAVIIDFETPHDGRTFPAGSGQRLANFVFDVSSAAPAGQTEVRLENQIGDPPINNIFVIRSHTVLPQLESAVISIEEPLFPPPRFFVRGDTDLSTLINITDTIAILNYLFLGNFEIRCGDQADTNDDGRINITDAVTLLNYLFLGGGFLPPPFPDAGLDPTPDDIPDCGLDF